MTGRQQEPPLIFAKLGGSLITDKRHRSTPELGIIRRLARELHAVLNRPVENEEGRASSSDIAPQPQHLVLGHGSGSFGHWEANQFGTRHGVHSSEEWHGFARVSAAALQLNRLVTESFIEAGVPVLSLQPSASAQVRGGTITQLALDPLCRALSQGLIPLVFGDVAFDDEIGGTILSTEDLFVYLARILKPSWILLFGNAPGVLGTVEGHGAGLQTIPRITPETYPTIRQQLGGSGYTDVTGGMADKVQKMVQLVQEQPQLSVRILSGNQPGNFRDALRNPEHHSTGTLICSASEDPRQVHTR